MGSMSLDYVPGFRMDVADGGRSNNYMQKFRLYETRSNFYMIGRDKHRTFWKVLKINRMDESELSIIEDSATYAEIECYDLLKRIHEGNKSTGGLKFVTTCYGIVGFIKFLGPYYMLLITKRKKIGTICGHEVYSVAKSEMIPVLSPTVELKMAYSKNENRYKKLLRAVDLTKDFFFSYSYNVMISLQKNMSSHETGLKIYENMFVWNEFLTNGIRNQLKNSIWTVALVHGFFRQVKLSVSGRDFDLILIARRSRHYAGTRYLKRGVNEKGRVANDVETEQIVIGDAFEGRPLQISSVVQNRGSIPLFWSQETSRLNVKPDIILSKTDHNYEATRLHFENLVQRYGNPIIILNLIKTREKKPRESILRTEFANAIELINKDLSHENRLKFLHWDLSKYSRNAASVLAYLVKVASNAMDLTGFFYFQVSPSMRHDFSKFHKIICEGLHASRNRLSLSQSIPHSSYNLIYLIFKAQLPCSDNGNGTDEGSYTMAEDNHEFVPSNDNENQIDADKSDLVKSPKIQKGVLRTNCIDCLDRTNVAQYVYGLVALGHQLHALGYIGVSSISLDSPLADDLMKIYESMGDILALQYGGSAAHNKIFSERRGQWKAATHSQEFLRTLQRYYSNAYMDGEKQDAINVFLGHFQPQKDKPALWELGSDQHYNTYRLSPASVEETARLIIKRSLSDGNILCGSDSAIDEENVIDSSHTLPANAEGCNVGLSELSSEISTCDSDPSFSSDSFNCSNFLDFDWVSSSGNSCEEEIYERSLLVGSSSAGSMPLNETKMESSSSYESGSSSKGKELASEDLSHSVAASSSADLTGYSKQFVNWVVNGDMLFPVRILDRVSR